MGDGGGGGGVVVRKKSNERQKGMTRLYIPSSFLGAEPQIGGNRSQRRGTGEI